ncbi:hypothetical protein [Gordonia polyisoprenivorans]|uniref:hypothetical protein n=1 Tax=Gordonia polyisoprenivorans TaxID=84595 RepID=UPI000B99EE24|nr:hypothetical protein [Gordonia polyisoprenivorans]OZC33914.1 hypothetical protein CJJ17_22255 [Gordonia polyisoprenivorans]
MTVTEPTTPPPAPARPGVSLRPADHPSVVLAVRWLVLAALTAIAFRVTILAVLAEMRALTLIIYVPVLLALVLIAAIGKSWRPTPEPPIYDRQTDTIVGAIVLLLSVSVQFMVNPRYSQAYITAHMDLLALWLFVLGGAIVMFGLRPVMRFRWTWALALLIWPVPMRVVILTAGGGPVAAGAVMVVVAAIATLIAVGRNRRRAFIGAVLSLGTGLVILIVMHVYVEGLQRILLVVVPAVAAALMSSLVMYFDYRNRHRLGWSPLGRNVHPPTLARVRRPGLLLLLATVVIAFIPVPVTASSWPSATIPGMSVGVPLALPADWRQESVSRYDWAERFYSSGSVMYRQMVVQRQGSSRFDKQSRPRRVAVDSVDTGRPLSLQTYPYIFRYDMVGDRFGPSVEVPMPHGVRAWMWTVIDDTRYLSYTVVSWWWNNGDLTQQVVLWSVDNHETDAYFPAPTYTVVGNVNTMFTVLFRGNAAIRDTTPTYKDRDLLVRLAAGIVDAQVEAAGREAGT